VAGQLGDGPLSIVLADFAEVDVFYHLQHDLQLLAVILDFFLGQPQQHVVGLLGDQIGCLVSQIRGVFGDGSCDFSGTASALFHLSFPILGLPLVLVAVDLHFLVYVGCSKGRLFDFLAFANDGVGDEWDVGCSENQELLFAHQTH